MNRSESKYFSTAAKMDAAFLELIEKKDFEYITVKEICEKAGVNRSTFYLHYETIGDLLSESAQYIVGQFVSYMPYDTKAFLEKLNTCSLDELYLITPEYLLPFLRFIKENRRIFRAAVENASILKMHDAYRDLNRYVLAPILERYDVPEEERGYMMMFYLNGLMAVVDEWLKGDCKDAEEHVICVIQKCIIRPKNRV